MFLVIALFAAFGLACASSTNEQRCAEQVVRRTNQCSTERGVQSGSINASAVLQFCRSPDRESLSTCYTRARGDCSFGETPEQRRLVLSGMDWASKSLDYVCTQDSIIEARLSCLDTVANGIRVCFRSANEEFIRNITVLASTSESPPTWEQSEVLIERLGRNREECVYELLRTNCDDVIAKVYGNFLYGTAVYMLDEANHRH